MDPGKPLAELMNQPSVLEPTMITDAKALYHSYQREGHNGGHNGGPSDWQPLILQYRP